MSQLTAYSLLPSLEVARIAVRRGASKVRTGSAPTPAPVS
jgi:hypothetical protein